MLGNQVELWETMLALIKIGAVIMPTTTAVGPDDLVDRIARGRRPRPSSATPPTPPSSTGIQATYRSWSSSVGDAAGRLARALGGVRPGARRPVPHPGNATDDRLLLYFTSGTTSRPKLVEHTHRSYPVGHLSTMYWLGLRPGDVHLNISSPGLGQARLVELLRAVAGRGDGARLQLRAVRRGRAARAAPHARASPRFCAPPTVWRMLINADLSGGAAGRCARRSAPGEPLNPEVIAQVERHWGLTIRDGFGQTETTAVRRPTRPASR